MGRWARRRQARQLLLDLAAEVNAIEATLGVNPHSQHATVADRLDAIEQRLDSPTPSGGSPHGR